MIRRRILGKTGLEISEIGFGSWAIGGNSYGDVVDADSLAAIEFALDSGINFVDTADVYGKGHSESLIGRTGQSRRDKVIIATKAGWDFNHGSIRANFDRSYLLFALEDSLQRLKTDHVDLFQLHNPPVALAKDHELLEELHKWKKAGKIRFYGVSVHGPEEAMAWMNETDVQTVQIAFHLLDQRAYPECFSLAKEKGCGIIAREPLACGMLTGKYAADFIFPKNDHRRRWPREKLKSDFEKIEKIKHVRPDATLVETALQFVLSFPEVSTVIPGMKTVEQVRQNLKTTEGNRLSESVLKNLLEIYRGDPAFSGHIYRN
jgi:aryl-alcohol dehydrogenase-like predicted oxidoreductase